MVKLAGPLFSESARGSLGPRLTFSERKKVKQVRFQRAQKDVLTLARTLQRARFKMAFSWWHELTPTEQAEWHEEGNNP